MTEEEGGMREEEGRMGGRVGRTDGIGVVVWMCGILYNNCIRRCIGRMIGTPQCQGEGGCRDCMWDLSVWKILPCVGGTDLAGAMMVNLLNTGVRWMEGRDKRMSRLQKKKKKK